MLNLNFKSLSRFSYDKVGVYAYYTILYTKLFKGKIRLIFNRKNRTVTFLKNIEEKNSWVLIDLIFLRCSSVLNKVKK